MLGWGKNVTSINWHTGTITLFQIRESMHARQMFTCTTIHAMKRKNRRILGEIVGHYTEEHAEERV